MGTDGAVREEQASADLDRVRLAQGPQSFARDGQGEAQLDDDDDGGEDV
ncbi:hypothetical protein ABT124_47035 [Streptomyces sp. NPDC001982]